MTTKLKFFGGFIVVPVVLIGENKTEYEFNFAIDTGANHTILQAFVAKMLGNNVLQSKRTLTSGSKANEKVQETIIDCVSVYNCKLTHYKVFIKHLPKTINYIDGLLGYDFFQELNLTLVLDFKGNLLSIT